MWMGVPCYPLQALQGACDRAAGSIACLRGRVPPPPPGVRSTGVRPSGSQGSPGPAVSVCVCVCLFLSVFSECLFFFNWRRTCFLFDDPTDEDSDTRKLSCCPFVSQ